MAYQEVFAEIKSGATLIIDGATGTELQRRNVPMKKDACCALAAETHPQVLRSIHEDYIRAGARVITANTFPTTREVLESVGLGHKFESLNRRAVEIAVEARDSIKSAKPVLVAGSITHTRPTRKGEWSPKISDVQKFESDCREMAAIHKAAGCDFIFAEMMGDIHFSPCVIRAAKDNGLPVWVGLSAVAQPDGRLGTYTNETVPFTDVVEPIVAAGGDLFGIMHTKADVLDSALEILKQHWSGDLFAYPDSLPPKFQEIHKMKLDCMMSGTEFVEHCRRWRSAGVRVFGGCCGLTVSHIQALNGELHPHVSHQG